MNACITTMLLCVFGFFGASNVVLEKQRSANFASMTRRKVDVFIDKLWSDGSDHLERLLLISRMFLNVAYTQEPDQEAAPGKESETHLIRLNAVDCTTFLEQCIAMAGVSSLRQAEAMLRKIRYIDGVVDYGHRKHFMMAQWIPMNQKEGFIEDITCRVGKEEVRWVFKRMDPGSWEKRKRKDRLPQLRKDQIPTGTYRLPIIPIEKALQYVAAIPPGTILNVVRVDVQSIPFRISHQGLVVTRKGKKYLRHAARVGYGRVVDEPLSVFLKRNLAYRRWPLEGVNLQAIKNIQSSAGDDKTH